MPIQVKNTFVDFGRQATGEDELEALNEEEKDFSQRQVTEPVPVNRRQLYMTPPDGVDRMLRGRRSDPVVEAADSGVDRILRSLRGGSAEEPEVEPRRQDTTESSELPRQLTGGDDDLTDQDWGWNRFVTNASLDNYHPALVEEMPPFPCMPPVPSWAPGIGQYPLPCMPFAPAATKPPEEWENVLTVMMRNLPNKFSQQMLLEDINAAGFAGTYDFLYLPIDPETRANRGYAFINFTDPVHSWSFKCFNEGRSVGQFNSGKVVTVMPATLQGYEANYSHYSSARVSRGDVGSRPLFLREAPSKQGSAPTQRRRRGRMSLIDAAAKRQNAQEAASASAGEAPSQVLDEVGPDPAPAAGSAELAVGVAAPAAAEAGPPEKRSISFCPFCGGKVSKGFKFCQFCGSSLPL